MRFVLGFLLAERALVDGLQEPGPPIVDNASEERLLPAPPSARARFTWMSAGAPQSSAARGTRCGFTAPYLERCADFVERVHEHEAPVGLGWMRWHRVSRHTESIIAACEGCGPQRWQQPHAMRECSAYQFLCKNARLERWARPFPDTPGERPLGCGILHFECVGAQLRRDGALFDSGFESRCRSAATAPCERKVTA